MVKTQKISFSYTEYDNNDELSSSDQELIARAIQASANAYAPYSKFRVGAALRLKSGKIICGANVENAAYPSGSCAERSAISNAVSNYPDDNTVSIAITAMNEHGQIGEPVPPCGNCRQIITEEETRTGNTIRIILAGKKKIWVIDSISCLLPLKFNNEILKINLP